MTNKTTSAIDLVERLTRKVQRLPAMGGGSIGLDADGKTTVTSYITDDGYRLVNPDGPEAADTITRLQADRELTLELLDALTNDDHKRLCEGRQYSCTCGYDEKVAELANLLALKFDRSSVGGE